MMTKQAKGNPEKLMILMFPLITLSLFVVAAVLYYILNDTDIVSGLLKSMGM